MYHVPFFQGVYELSNERSKNGDGKVVVRFLEEKENEDHLECCMQMTWHYLTNQKNI